MPMLKVNTSLRPARSIVELMSGNEINLRTATSSRPGRERGFVGEFV